MAQPQRVGNLKPLSSYPAPGFDLLGLVLRTQPRSIRGFGHRFGSHPQHAQHLSTAPLDPEQTETVELHRADTVRRGEPLWTRQRPAAERFPTLPSVSETD